MTQYRLHSAPLVHTPGLLAWAMNAYHFPEDRPQMLKIMTETFDKVPTKTMDDLLAGKIPYQVEGDTIIFEAAE